MRAVTCSADALGSSSESPSPAPLSRGGLHPRRAWLIPFLSFSCLITPHITSRQPARIARSSGEEGQQADAQAVSWFHQLYRCQGNVSPRRSCRRIIANLKVIVSGRSQPSDLVWAANDRRSVRQSTGAGLPIGVLSL